MVAVLRLGTRGSRYSATRALEGLFAVDHIKVGEAVGMLSSLLLKFLALGQKMNNVLQLVH